LHQMNIESINKAFVHTCPNLQILYLQNNLISKIENLKRLRGLKYLNLAVNNITRVEGLERSENLEKLDFTINFIDLEGLITIERLRRNFQLKELYMVGNPCTKWEPWRAFIVATLPQLKKLDGKDITASERILATQRLAELRAELVAKAQAEVRAAGRELEEEIDDDSEEEEEEEDSEVTLGGTVQDKSGRSQKWTPEVRMKDYQRQVEKEREKAEQEEADKRRRDPFYAEKVRMEEERKEQDRLGVFRQRNEGRWDFTFDETRRDLVLTINFPKFMDTSLIDIDVQPQHVTCVAKGKTIALELPEEVRADNASAARSITTGALVLTLPKLKPLAEPVAPPTKQPPPTTTTLPSATKPDLTGSVDFRHITKESAKTSTQLNDTDIKPAIQDEPQAEQPKWSDDFVDDDEVPPLE